MQEIAVRVHRGRPFAPILAALVVAAVLLPAWSATAPQARAAGAADAQASELVRLINGERVTAGKSALGLDRYLAGKARDGAIWCPNDASKVMAGRAKDIALNGPFSHNLRLCSQYSVTDAMKTWGYGGARGEILAMNSGYGTSQVTYAYGCTPSVSECPGPETSAYATTARAMTGWMHSSGHYSIIVGNYDRVGCGAWVGSNGTYYYSCLFSRGGGPVATPKPPSKATARPGAGGGAPHPSSVTAGATATPAATRPPPWPTPSGACGQIAVARVSPDAGPTQAAPEEDGAGDASAGDAAGPASSGLPPPAQVVAVAGGATGMAVLAWPLLGVLRRRRGRRAGASTDGQAPPG
jgi:uncharacterized protein YkwD